jgi:hypothetical protein
MPLASVDRSGIPTANGVHFPMRDGQRSVRVHITLEALWGEKGPPAKGDHLERFETSRRLFEFMAARKYDSARPTSKITITAEDVVLTAQHMQRKTGRGSVVTELTRQHAAAERHNQRA